MNKRKEAIRALAEKKGISYQAAANFAAKNVSVAWDERDLIADILEHLKTTSASRVVTGRVPTVGRSANHETAYRHMKQLRDHPVYFAETGVVNMTVPEAIHRALLAAGALASDGTVQMIRSFRNERGTTFSVRCSNCARWVFCGDGLERDGTCHCGQKHRVVFDKHPDWSMRQGAMCMDCGAPFSMSESSEDRNPWTRRNSWQQQCNRCRESLPSRESHVAAGLAEDRPAQLTELRRAVEAAHARRAALSSEIIRPPLAQGEEAPTIPLAALNEYAEADVTLRQAVEAELNGLRATYLRR